MLPSLQFVIQSEIVYQLKIWEFGGISSNSMEQQLMDLFGHFQRQFGIGPGLGPSSGTCLLEIDGISHSFIKFVYQALAMLHNTDPWKRLRPEHLFRLRVNKRSDRWSNKQQLFRCAQFLGGDGGDLGLHLFKFQQDALKVSSPDETKLAPNVEILRVIFEKENLLCASNKRMVASLGLEPSGTNLYPIIDVARCSSSGKVEIRDPTMEELRYFIAVIRAITLLHPFLELDTDKVTSSGRNINFKPFIEMVDVQLQAKLTIAMDPVTVIISHPPTQTYEEEIFKYLVKYVERISR